VFIEIFSSSKKGRITFHPNCLFSTNMKIWREKRKERGEYVGNVSTVVF